MHERDRQTNTPLNGNIDCNRRNHLSSVSPNNNINNIIIITTKAEIQVTLSEKSCRDCLLFRTCLEQSSD